MDPNLLMSMDPAEASIWSKLMQNSSSAAPMAPGLPMQNVPNLALMSTQRQPAQDKLTMQQAARATVPPAPNMSNASRMLASNPENASVKRQAQSSLLDLANDPSVLESMGNERNEISDLRGRIQNYLDRPQQMDLTPLAALTDAWTGSNFSRNYQAPETPQERAKNVAALQNIMAQRQGDLTKQQLDLLRDKITAQASILKAEKENAPLMARLQDQQDQSSHQRTLQKVKSDKTISDLFGKSRNIANAQSLLEQAQITPPEQFDEFQQTIRRNLGITGTSGLAEREKTAFDNLGLKAARAEQYLFGKPQDVKESQQEFFKHLQDLASLVQKNNKTQIGGRLKALTAGNETMYRRRKDLASDLASLETATLDQFSPDNLSPGSNTRDQDSSHPRLSFEEYKKRKREGTL